MKRALALCLILLLTLSSCRERGQSPQPVPTRASTDALATAIVLTQNAPPEAFREGISFPQIDANLESISFWRYDMLLQFDGVFSGTPRPASASTRVQVSYDQFSTRRRVHLEATGVLVDQENETIMREAVRMGPDTFLVQENTCLGAADGDAAILADLHIGELIGGVTHALPGGAREVINGQEVYRFDFTQAELNLPYIQLSDTSPIINISSELWVAPEYNVVIRFWVTMNVQNAIILLNNVDNPLPVTGQVIIRYDLYDIGVDPNISVPFGC